MDIGQNFKRGILYTALGKYSNVVIQLLVTAVLSRILTPEEYGVVAVVNVFLIFFQMLADSGIGPAIIQNKKLNQDDLRSIFTLTIYSGFILSALFCLLGYPMSLVYGDFIYINLYLLLGICVFFYTITIVPQAILTKEMRFKQVNLLTLVANILSGIIGILLALGRFGIYSLIFSNIVKAVALFLVLFGTVKLPLSRKIDKNSIKKIFEFSKFQFLFNFWNYFARNLDNLLIGRFINSSALGYYDKAYQLSLYPNQVLSQIITPVIHPVMSNFEKNRQKMGEVYLQVSNVLIVLGIPISAYLYFNAKDIIVFMFGNSWSDSIPVFRILAVTVWLQMANSPTGAFYQATNRTNSLFKVGMLTSTINIVAIIFGIMMKDINVVALMLLFSFTLSLVINTYYLTQKILYIHLRSYMRSIFVSIVIIAPYILLNVVVFNFNYDTLLNLLLQAGVLLLTWGLGMFISKEYRQLLSIFRS